jgi:DNA-binding protein H-NS
LATYHELREQAEELARRAEQMRRELKQAVIEDIRAKVAEYGITAQEIFERHKRPKPSVPVRPKYRDASTGATWTGRGMEPRWIRGKDRRQFLIDQE